MGVTTDRGQASASYLGIIVLVAAIVAAIFAVGMPGDVAGGIEQAICRITSLGEDGGCGRGHAGPEGTADPQGGSTPRELAEAGDYVAIGDSFSSGEGAYDYVPGTDTESNQCHRSRNAYSSSISDEFDFRGGVRVVTCSGARVRNVMETGQNGEPPQIEAVTPGTSLVTVGISGNDADWVPVIQDCLTNDADGCRDGEEEVRRRMEEAADRAFDVYEQARERAGEDARVVAVGYPRFFPENPVANFISINVGCVSVPLDGTRCARRFALTPDEQRYMNGLTRAFNDMLAERAAEAGVEFVDMNDAFDGHEFGTEEPYFNALELDWPDCAPTSVDCIRSIIQAETAHPNAEGQRRMGELVTDHIENP